MVARPEADRGERTGMAIPTVTVEGGGQAS